MTALDRSSLPLAVVVILAFALLHWFGLRPTSIVNDWMGWRQADTQSIALNTLRPEAQFNVPMVNWGGATPQPVEAEFQGYTELLGSILRITGGHEWPGQLLSLFSLIATGLVLFLWLRGHYGHWPAIWGLGVFLTSRNALFLGSSVQPDGPGILCFVLAVMAFERWLRHGDARNWMLWVGLSVATSLLKPTNLQIGIAQFLLVVLAHRAVLTRPMLWIGWLLVLACVGAQLWHGASIHAATELTFGVASGGDRKFPTEVEIFQFSHYKGMARVALDWSLGPLGVLALVFLLVRRKLSALEWALGIAHVIGLVLAMRYTASQFLGSHYHFPGAVIAALVVAHAFHELRQLPPWPARAVGALAAACLVLVTTWNVDLRLNMGRDGFREQPYVQIADALREQIAPGTAIIVRSEYPRYTEGWGNGLNNFEDPRMFYLLKTSGWPIPVDETGAEELARRRAQGALWYIEPADTQSSPEQRVWLRSEATQVLDESWGRAWRFNTGATPDSTAAAQIINPSDSASPSNPPAALR